MQFIQQGAFYTLDSNNIARKLKRIKKKVKPLEKTNQ